MATILIVDDDPNNRLLLRTLLAHAGHTVVEAAAGDVALATARERRPDLTIVDLHMPGMDGVSLVRALRADPATTAGALALYTGTAISEAIEDFMQAYGIAQLIPKPAEPEEILRCVALALARVTRPNAG